MTTHTYKSNGSDGYTPGTWGWVILIGGDRWHDGGYESRELARAACKRHMRRLGVAS